MPLHIGLAQSYDNRADRDFIGISDAEIIELASAFRRFGLIRNVIDEGLFYLTQQACDIFGVDCTKGPVDFTRLMKNISPPDRPSFAAFMEEAVGRKASGHLIFKVLADSGKLNSVRMVLRAVERDGVSELTGIVYDFFDKLPASGFAVQL